jgi:4-alpha-glucanotransferase
MSERRASGLLLHITSLPGPYGTGDLGPEAYRFADFLQQAGQTLWQVLPIVPTGYGYSPYAAPSTFAGNPLFISPELLVEEGLLDAHVVPDFPVDHVDFPRVESFKADLLEQAWHRFRDGFEGGSTTRKAFDSFCSRNASWLDDYTLFEALKQEHDLREWTSWSKPLAMRDARALETARERHADRMDMYRFWQFLFDDQWRRLKTYCNARNIRIFGDLPIYVAQDSADVWANKDLFHLDGDGRATVVSGVPPDYFSTTGQRWGNPIYRWDRMKASDYEWWSDRMARILDLVDLVRLDHFRGFEAFWEVPASEPTAVNGVWQQGPGADLFHALQRRLGPLPLIAENLGVITDGVTDLMTEFGFPGMAILQFAFDSGPDNEFLPHNYREPLVAYTGTHDNDTFMGWWHHTRSTQDAGVVAQAKSYAREYLDVECHPEDAIHERAVRSLMGSVARFVVTPVQDVLGLGGEARMNTPGLDSGNWGWRMRSDALTDHHARWLGSVTRLFGRAPQHGE